MNQNQKTILNISESLINLLKVLQSSVSSQAVESRMVPLCVYGWRAGQKVRQHKVCSENLAVSAHSNYRGPRRREKERD